MGWFPYGCYRECGIDILLYRWQANRFATGLISEFHGNSLNGMRIIARGGHDHRRSWSRALPPAVPPIATGNPAPCPGRSYSRPPAVRPTARAYSIGCPILDTRTPSGSPLDHQITIALPLIRSNGTIPQ